MKTLTALTSIAVLATAGLLASCDDVIQNNNGSDTGADPAGKISVEFEFNQAFQEPSTEQYEFPAKSGETMELPWVDSSDPTVVLIEEVADDEVTIVVQTQVYTGYYSQEEGATYTLGDDETAEFFRNEDDVAVHYFVTFNADE